MTDLPAMLLWTDAYLSDTTHLSTFEHGVYLLILMAMWRSGGRLPNNDERLARTARTTVDKWKRASVNIRPLLTEEGEWITQKRLSQELGFAKARRTGLAKAGSLGGIANSLKRKERIQASLTDRCSNHNHNHNHKKDIALTGLSSRDDGGEKRNARKVNGHGETEALVDSFVEAWDALARACGLATCRAITDKRKSHILARAKDATSALGFETAQAAFSDLFSRIRKSPFLLGEHNGREWKCDIDWVINENNFLKIMEGKYARQEKQF